VLDHPLATRVLSDGAGLAQVPEQLGDEEGIAVGLPEERVGQSEALFAQCMAGRGLHEGLHAVLVEALELEAGEATVSPEQSERLAQARGLGQLAVTERAEHEEANRVLGRHQVP